jgi:hypothetical protein
LTKLVLYAQPLDNEPHLSKLSLRKGEYKEGGGPLGGIAFTDVGKAVWETLDRIYSDFELDAIEMGMGPSPWAIRFTTSQMKLVVSRRGYRSFEGAQGSYITLDFDGDKHVIYRFLKSFLKTLRRPPWEMAFPGAFRLKTHLKKAEVAESWEKFASGISLKKEDEAGEGAEEGEADAEESSGTDAAVRTPVPAKKVLKKLAPRMLLNARAFISFEGDFLVLNVKVDNGSDISLENVQVTPRASLESIQFGTPAKVISYLKPSESLTLTFPLPASAEGALGDVWAEIEGSAQDKKLSAVTEKRPLKAVMGALEPVAQDTLEWHRRTGTLVRRDEVRSKVYMAAAEAFDEMLSRLKTTGLHLLEPEVIHSGTSYAGHLKMYAEDAQKRPYALALDCVGDYKESKITLHFYAESAELVMALREKTLAAIREGG